MSRIVAGRERRFPKRWGHAGFAGLALAALVAAVPGGAAAQNYTVLQHTEPYLPLPIAGGVATEIPLSNAHSSAPYTIADEGVGPAGSPFPIEFYGQTYSDFLVSVNGVAFFGNPNLSDSQRPWANSESNQHNLIAVWWDDLICPSGQPRKQVLGTAPRRTLIVEWHCSLNGSSATTFQAQLWLEEGSRAIRLKYGTANLGISNFTASIGLENAAGTLLPGLPCSTSGSCNVAQFPAGKVLTFSVGPDPAVTAVVPPTSLESGVVSPYVAFVRNLGSQNVPSVGVRFWLSSDEHLDPGDVELGTSADLPVAVGQEVVFSVDAAPSGISSPSVYVIAEVNYDRRVTIEDSQANNILVVGPVPVSGPDPLVESVLLPGEVRLGQPFALEWIAGNGGNRDAINVPYVVVVSRDDLITLDDPQIHSGTVSVPASGFTPVTDTVTIPEGLVEAGRFWLGVILDPATETLDLVPANNTLSTHQPVPVGANWLQVVTEGRLPDAEVGSHYCMTLEARGGNGIYSWSVANGEMPFGLEFVEERSGLDPSEPPVTTYLCGYPALAGDYAFRLSVSSGGLNAVRDVQLTVNTSGMPLTLVNGGLPQASYGLAYDAALRATGGTGPYQWSVAGGELPPGIHLDPQGWLRGVPAADGTFAFRGQVTDSAGTRAEGEFVIEVAPPARLTCATSTLPTVKVGETRQVELHAAGGVRPYTWSNVESRRFTSDMVDGVSWPDAAPHGVTLVESGTALLAPTQVGRYFWQVRATDAEGTTADCYVYWEVVYDNGLVITTTQLREAYIGADYAVELKTSGDTATWSLFDGSTLPPGLGLTADGKISGRVDASALEPGEEKRTYAFAVQAVAADFRGAVAPFSITVRREPDRGEPLPEPPAENGSNCSAGVGEPTLLALGAALALASRRRRR